MSGQRYSIGEPVPASSRRLDIPRPYKNHKKYATGRRRTSSGRLTKGVWAYHVTKGWKKVASA